MRQTYKRGIMTARGRLGGTEWIRQSGLAVDGDDWDARVMMLRRELSPPVSGSL